MVLVLFAVFLVDRALAYDGNQCQFLRPSELHFMVINLDRSVPRLRRIMEVFRTFQLPPFERIAGIEVQNGNVFDVPRQYQGPPHKGKKYPVLNGDFGTFLSHRAAWKKIAAGHHEWVVVLEDDGIPVSKEAVTAIPSFPDLCDHLDLAHGDHPARVFKPLSCHSSNGTFHVVEAFGTQGYILNPDMAKIWLSRTEQGIYAPIDVVMISEGIRCGRKGPSAINHRKGPQQSIRKVINGQIDRNTDMVEQN
jgi:GR25 family glycosyltransferase involved in LPS biosynthesis